MLKGHIDSIEDDHVSGWIYSRERPLTGERVLAFCGEKCIGAAEVEIYRDDLYKAGLGDGRLGFQIFFDSAAPINPKNIHVRMEGSDFSLITKDFWKTSSSLQSNRCGLFSQFEIDRVDWMASLGWLTQSQYALTKSINRMGVYQRMFSRADIQNSSLDELVREAYADCLSIMLQVSKKNIHSKIYAETFSGDFEMLKTLPFEVIAVYGANFSCKLHEGRHRTDAFGDELAMPICYDNSSYQVMFVHVACCEGIAQIQDGALQLLGYAN